MCAPAGSGGVNLRGRVVRPHRGLRSRMAARSRHAVCSHHANPCGVPPRTLANRTVSRGLHILELNRTLAAPALNALSGHSAGAAAVRRPDVGPHRRPADGTRRYDFAHRTGRARPPNSAMWTRKSVVAAVAAKRGCSRPPRRPPRSGALASSPPVTPLLCLRQRRADYPAEARSPALLPSAHRERLRSRVDAGHRRRPLETNVRESRRNRFRKLTIIAPSGTFQTP